MHLISARLGLLLDLYREDGGLRPPRSSPRLTAGEPRSIPKCRIQFFNGPFGIIPNCSKIHTSAQPIRGLPRFPIRGELPNSGAALHALCGHAAIPARNSRSTAKYRSG
jgi:hypothetical protein